MILEICAILISLFLLYKAFLSRNEKKGDLKSIHDIPCPNRIPFIGSITDFFHSEVDQWNKARERAHKYYPIYRVQVFNSNLVCLLDPDDIGAILGDLRETSKGDIHDFLRQLIGNGLINSEGDIWHKRRKLLTRSFHFSVLKNYVDIFNKEMEYFNNRMKKFENQPVDILHYSKLSMVKIVNDTIFGDESNVTENEVEEFVEAAGTVINIVHYNSTSPYLSWIYKHFNLKKQMERALKIIGGFLQKTLEGKDLMTMNQDGWKMLDLLLGAPELFNTQEVKDEINTFLLGGHDGSATMLCYTMLSLANYPKHQEAVYREIKQVLGERQEPTFTDLMNMRALERFIKEVLRLYPAAPYIVRQLNEGITTKSGYSIPAGTVLLIQIFDIQRNPNFFPEPNKFDPDRFLADNIKNRPHFTFIPFSAGPRNCLAQKYLMVQMKACVCGILKKFRVEPVDLIDNIEFVHNGILTTKDPVKVKFVERSP